jgi:hypothetical protein
MRWRASAHDRARVGVHAGTVSTSDASDSIEPRSCRQPRCGSGSRSSTSSRTRVGAVFEPATSPSMWVIGRRPHAVEQPRAAGGSWRDHGPSQLKWHVRPSNKFVAYLRFVVSKQDPDSGVEAGVFGVAYKLSETPNVRVEDRESLRDALAWFERHRATPDCFNRSGSKGYYLRNTRGIAWFRDCAMWCQHSTRSGSLPLAPGETWSAEVEGIGLSSLTLRLLG